MPTLVTLLSDFGSRSPYPAAMKAVLVSYGQHLLVDISHDVPRHDIPAGAYLLSTIVPFVPAGTVHLAVVDPGVGTARRGLIVASGGQYFVGPDNGLLLPAARRVGRPRAYLITDERLLRAVRSTTFHGRDLFAPAAAVLARGTPPEVLGRPVSEIVDLDFGTGRIERGVLAGAVIYIDPFGNVITNIPVSLLPAAGTPLAVRVGRRGVPASVGSTYGDRPRGRAVVVPGSDGFVEIAVREGSAASLLGATPGTSVRIGTKPIGMQRGGGRR